jgi:hypothetical protein
MSKFRASLNNYDSDVAIDKMRDQYLSSLSIFILCDSCYWCATYLDKTRIPTDNICSRCGANNDNSELTSFPVMFNESFTFDHNGKRGVELEFKTRHKHA